MQPPSSRSRIRQMICDARPEQLKMEFALWSRIAVRELILREYGVELHVRSVGKLLWRWGFTPQKPIRCAMLPLGPSARRHCSQLVTHDICSPMSPSAHTPLPQHQV